MSQIWYFSRLAFLAVPWNLRNNNSAKGTLFKQYYLVRAKNIRSAFTKAEHILSASEHCEGGGRLNGRRVVFKKVGILDLEPLYQPLQSGAELFDESESGVAYAKIKKYVISSQRKTQMITREKKNSK